MNCEYCGARVLFVRKGRRYCSERCGDKARRHRANPNMRHYGTATKFNSPEQPSTCGAFNAQSFQHAPVERIIRQFNRRGYLAGEV